MIGHLVTNRPKLHLRDVDQKCQASMKLKIGATTRARMKKLKASNRNEDNGMVAYIEKALKNKFEEFGDQGEASKLFSICSISKDHSTKQLEGENWLSVREGHPTADGSPTPTLVVFNQGLDGHFESLSYRLARVSYSHSKFKILNRGSSRKGGDPWKGVESKLQSKVHPHQSGFIMSTEGQLPNQSHQGGTSDPTRMNLNETLRSMQQSIEGWIIRNKEQIVVK
ncbi:hypothetical protein M9H77_30532 [Catharanthus roseus]|uniref:Uncharacterized protein n=1 Tax=Catharanthus roseus TaxID=4058 RepID=A0ACB9ZZD3_CATRO|nr:hypothetical protein M9H77_30532 [Catharanthus roseus]